MDLEGRERPGPKRERHLDWVPMVEYCPDCTRQVVWFKRVDSGLVNKTTLIEPRVRRFRRCAGCAAKTWHRRVTA
jgi:hypothetical protein